MKISHKQFILQQHQLQIGLISLQLTQNKCLHLRTRLSKEKKKKLKKKNHRDLILSLIERLKFNKLRKI